MKRSIVLQGLDRELNLSKVTCIRKQVAAEMIHLDKMPDGTWRLIYSENVIPDIAKLEGLVILRED